MILQLHIESLNEFPRPVIPHLNNIVVSIAPCQYLAILIIDGVSWNMGTEYVSNRLFLSKIPDFDIWVPSSRDKFIGVVGNRFDWKYSIWMVLILIIGGWANINSLRRFCIVVQNFNREILLPHDHIFTCSRIITAHYRRLQMNSLDNFSCRF